MVKPTLGIALAVLTALPPVPPVRTMYNDAFARERTVRAAMNEDDADPAVLADLRAVVARYERVVRHYPASSYCDNALWQAAELELDAFAKFGQPQDRDAGLRLLRQLASGYPRSKLAAQVPAQFARWTAEPNQPPLVVDPPKPTREPWKRRARPTRAEPTGTAWRRSKRSGVSSLPMPSES